MGEESKSGPQLASGQLHSPRRVARWTGPPCKKNKLQVRCGCVTHATSTSTPHQGMEAVRASSDELLATWRAGRPQAGSRGWGRGTWFSHLPEIGTWKVGGIGGEVRLGGHHAVGPLSSKYRSANETWGWEDGAAGTDACCGSGVLGQSIALSGLWWWATQTTSPRQ